MSSRLDHVLFWVMSKAQGCLLIKSLKKHLCEAFSLLHTVSLSISLVYSIFFITQCLVLHFKKLIQSPLGILPMRKAGCYRNTKEAGSSIQVSSA